ncbi:hypothetical protein ACFYL6_20255 [Micromonospora sp. NPDC007208]|uniref:hypothetical protein n=1 Tax=Micromonospora sp. NPDC007208 TaxID=3364236 RepID=UPI00369ED190
MADEGTNVVDLTQTWSDAKTINGDNGNYTDPASVVPKAPDVRSDGEGGFEDSYGRPTNDKGILVDDNNVPLDPGQPFMGSFTVHLDTVYSAEQTLLHEAKNQIAQFEAFRDEVVSQEAWIFFAENAEDLVPYYHDDEPLAASDGSNNQWDVPAGTYADGKDGNPEETAKLVHAQNQLLQGCGTAIHLVGTFVGKLNDTGQMYAGADRASWAPDPD